MTENADTESVAASSIGSTDSQDWGVKTKTTTEVIDNIDMLDSNNAGDHTEETLTIEQLQQQIAQLRATNSQLLAATQMASSISGSHPIAQQPPDGTGAPDAMGGGDH